MERRRLGNTGLEVSRLCYGTLTIGPLQADLGEKEGGRLIRAAYERGVDFFDTAELYRTYPHLRAGLDGLWGRVHIVSRSYAVDAKTMRRSVEDALRALGTDSLSVFMIHEVDSAAALRGHEGALEYLRHAKEQGLIRATGISTHSVEAVHAGALHPGVDVIQALINHRGLGIKGGGVGEMLAAIEFAHMLGKGVYAMKPLGGGHLGRDAVAAFKFLAPRPELASIAVGMRSLAEIDLNLRLIEGAMGPGERCDEETAALMKAVGATERFLHIQDWCKGCGECVRHCPQQALGLVGGRAVVNPADCVLCGYCGAACAEMAIKIV